MKLTAKNSSEDFTYEMCPAGNHVGRCYMVCDLGMQESEWEGKKKMSHKVRLAFEFPLELMKEGEYAGQPFSIAKAYTVSLSEKATLRHHIEAWRGRAFTPEELEDFNVVNVLGAPCMVNVVHKVSQGGRDYAMIAGIAALPKGMTCPDAVNPVVKFSLEEYDEAIYQGLPDWLKEKINTKGIGAEEQAPTTSFDEPVAGMGQEFDDDIPF